MVWVNPDGSIRHTYTPTCWDNFDLDSEIFSMIRETLQAVGCLHDESHGDATPPMMFNDWIRCAVAKREKRVKELEDKVQRLERELEESYEF